MSNLRKAIPISILNQIASSGASFLITIYLAKNLSVAEFGLYGLGSAVMLFLVGIGNSVLLTQMVVHAPARSGKDREDYVAVMLTVTAVASFVAAAILVLILAIASLWPLLSERNAVVVALFFLIAPLYLLKEFFVRAAYSEHKEGHALYVNSCFAVGIFALLGVGHSIYGAVKLTSFLWMYAASLAVAASVGAFRMGVRLRWGEQAPYVQEAALAWRGGKYSALAHIVISIRTQAHTVILSSMVGVAGVGVINAARVYVTPVTFIMPALTQLFLPRLVDSRIKSEADALKMGRAFTSFMFWLTVIYSLLLIISYDWIAPITFGEKYGSLLPLVIAWCGYSALSAVRSGQETILISQLNFISQAKINALGALFAVVTVTIFTALRGVDGALLGLILSELAVVLLFRLLLNARAAAGSA